jgi:prevent-host-death family protein
MSQIRPISDLRNNFAEISRSVHENGEPVILTKNGYGSMVVLSFDAYERMRYETGIAMSLQEAEVEAASTVQRYSHQEIMASLRGQVEEADHPNNV